jgi:GTP cyclohydrolase IA
MNKKRDIPGETVRLSMENSLRTALTQLFTARHLFSREGLRDTPARVVRALFEMTSGYEGDPAEVLGRTFPADGYDEVVAVSGIPFNSLCEHHLMPFFGTVGVAYLPHERIVGLSKLPRVVDIFAKRLQVQERMTKEIGDAIASHLVPAGSAVVVTAVHACLSCRGALKPGARMTTSDIRGSFRDSPAARAEVLGLLR